MSMTFMLLSFDGIQAPYISPFFVSVVLTAYAVQRSSQCRGPVLSFFFTLRYVFIHVRINEVSVAIGIRICYVNVDDNGSGVSRDGLVLMGERYGFACITQRRVFVTLH